MTPKRKAKDLVRDMEFEIPYVYDPTEPQGCDIAKKCALIAVDEIISELEDMTNFTGNKFSSEMIKYWQEVRNEVEKL